MNRIHDSLQRVFQRQHLVFWYDAAGEWKDDFQCSWQHRLTSLTWAASPSVRASGELLFCSASVTGRKCC